MQDGFCLGGFVDIVAVIPLGKDNGFRKSCCEEGVVRMIVGHVIADVE